MSKILLVDDLPELIEAEKEILKEYDSTFEIETLTNPEDAIDMISKNDFDVIITDIVMPKMDGLQLLREIRKNFDTPVIIYSAYVHLYPPSELLDQGASFVISKPANLEFLIRCIKDL